MMIVTEIEINIPFRDLGTCLTGRAEITINPDSEAITGCVFFAERWEGREFITERVNTRKFPDDPVCRLIRDAAEAWLYSAEGQLFLDDAIPAARDERAIQAAEFRYEIDRHGGYE
jgi:hypothetical protein